MPGPHLLLRPLDDALQPFARSAPGEVPRHEDITRHGNFSKKPVCRVAVRMRPFHRARHRGFLTGHPSQESPDPCQAAGGDGLGRVFPR